MPKVRLRVEPPVDLAAGFEAIRQQLGIPDAFPPAALAEAEDAAARGPSVAAAVDRRDVGFVTIDPAGSRDLDQAVALSRTAGGYRVQYAIADVAAFVAPGGAVDAEARSRAVTVYLPDQKTPLHPTVLSEGAASLLPGQDRQALVWDIALDGDGLPTSVRIERATVRSRAQLTYDGVQAALDGGTADEQLLLLREVGRLREAQERARHAVSLPVPEQRVVADADSDGRYRLDFRAPLPAEGWNSQISLLAGMCAARLMLDGGVGILRTLPSPPPETVDALRRRAAALGIAWPADGQYADVVRALDPAVPEQAALIVQAARLFRGAGYLAFTDGAPAPAVSTHAAVAAPYAHVTAPLRRLADRFANEVVLALAAGGRPPGWAVEALDALPALMAEGGHREGASNAMALDLVEASVLGGCVGAELRGVVVSQSKGGAQVQIRDPAVVATVAHAHVDLGGEVRLRVAGVDLAERRVDLRLA